MARLFEGSDKTFALRRALLDVYGAADKRKKRIESMTIFRVDQSQHRNGADGQPLSDVCMILVDATGDDPFKADIFLKVMLLRNVPMNSDDVEQWITATDATFNKAQWPATQLSF